MATRDLSVPYVRLRSALHRKAPGKYDDGNSGLLNASGAVIDTTPLSLSGASPIYVEMVNEVQNDINGIQYKMEELTKSHDQRLKIGFDPAAEQEKEREIEILTSEITRTFNLAAAKLKRIAREGENAHDGTESKVIKNIQRALATKLHSLSSNFRNIQKAYLGQMKSMREGQSFTSILGGSASQSNDRDMGFTDAQMSELANAEEDVDERMREIQRVARSVEELATLFKDLSMLIVEQGTILDRIDHNMESVVVSVKGGVKEIVAAENIQKKTAKATKCIVVLMALCAIMVVVIIIRKA